jgi:hypothetical protein
MFNVCPKIVKVPEPLARISRESDSDNGADCSEVTISLAHSLILYSIDNDILHITSCICKFFLSLHFISSKTLTFLKIDLACFSGIYIPVRVKHSLLYDSVPVMKVLHVGTKPPSFRLE